MNVQDRINNLFKLMEQEKEPDKRRHHLNVLKQLQTQLELL